MFLWSQKVDKCYSWLDRQNRNDPGLQISLTEKIVEKMHYQKNADEQHKEAQFFFIESEEKMQVF